MCRLHVRAGKRRSVQSETHRPKLPADQRPSQTCASQDRLRCAVDLPPAWGLFRMHNYRRHLPLPHHYGQPIPQGPGLVQTDAAARTVEVSEAVFWRGWEGQGGPILGLPRASGVHQWVQILLVRQLARRLLGTQHCELASLRFGVSLN